MELFTMTSLLLAIFGATYAAISSLTSTLRQNVEKDLHAEAERAKSLLDDQSSMQDEDSLIGTLLENDSQKIRRLLLAWKLVPVIQAFTFVVSIYAVAIVALSHWSEINTGHSPAQLADLRESFPWKAVPGMITFSAISNFLFLVAPVVIYLWLRKLISRARGLEPSDPAA